MRTRFAALAAAAVMLAAAPAAAQIVNVQGSLAKEPEPGWSGQASAGLEWQTGNVDIIKVSGAGSVIYSDGPWLGLLLVRGEYSEGLGVKLSEKTFEHLRGRRKLTERWLWEAFLQHEYDDFRRLAMRAVAGTGPAVRLIKEERGSLTAGLAYMLEREHLSELPAATDSGEKSWYHRASAYLTGSVSIGEQLLATQTVYAQPRIDEPSDIVLLSESSLTSKLNEMLGVIISFNLSYDSEPPETIEKVQTSLKVILAATF